MSSLWRWHIKFTQPYTTSYIFNGLRLNLFYASVYESPWKIHNDWLAFLLFIVLCWRHLYNQETHTHTKRWMDDVKAHTAFNENTFYTVCFIINFWRLFLRSLYALYVYVFFLTSVFNSTPLRLHMVSSFDLISIYILRYVTSIFFFFYIFFSNRLTRAAHWKRQ